MNLSIIFQIQLISCSGSDVETTFHFFVYCLNFSKETATFMSEISEINIDILTCIDFKIVATLLFRDTSFNHFDNNKIFNESLLTMS